MNSHVRHSVEETPDQLATRLMQQAHNRDGLPEILIGATFLLAAGYNAMMLSPHWKSLGFIVAFFADIVVFVSLCLASTRLLRWVRRRFLIGRVGYVRPKSSRPKLTFIAIAAPIIFSLLLVGAFVFRIPHLDGLVIAAMGLFIGWVCSFWGMSIRFKVLGTISLALGIVLAFSPISFEARLAIFFGCIGLLSLASGSLVLIRFLRQPLEAGE